MFTKVLDGRKQRVRGLWQRGTRFYAQLSIEDFSTGQKRTRRGTLVNSDSNHGRNRRPGPRGAKGISRFRRLWMIAPFIFWRIPPASAFDLNRLRRPHSNFPQLLLSQRVKRLECTERSGLLVGKTHAQHSWSAFSPLTLHCTPKVEERFCDLPDLGRAAGPGP